MNQENKINPNEERLEEQKAPLKNTDHAFVQVSKDGSPHIPDAHKEQEEEGTAKKTPDSQDGR